MMRLITQSKPINWTCIQPKTIMHVALFFILIAAVVRQPLFAGSKGDVNDDDTINILDVTRTINIILGKPPAPTTDERWAADFNSDGSIFSM